MNIALNKNILEKGNWKRPEELTDGNTSVYDGFNGYSHTSFPGYCTLDLEKLSSIKLIRFLLWDKDPRTYKYRLLISKDNITWKVIYDTSNNSFSGWQAFKFKDAEEMRYIKIHGLFNTANEGFHIVEIEAHDGDDDLKYQYTNEVTVSGFDQIPIEIKDGLNISKKISEIASQIEATIDNNPALNKDFFSSIINDLRIRINDVAKIEASGESIVRQIMKPISTELTRSNRIGNFSVALGIIGGLLSIFSILNIIFKWIT